jgi:glycosyltransferase involved in cell wall biosynthesis
VEVLCADDPQSPWLAAFQLNVHAAGHGRFRKYGWNPRLGRWLAGNIARFDAVVVHSIWMYFSHAVRTAARRTAVPYFLFIHGALDPWFRHNYPLKHIKKAIYWRLVEHRVVRDAERVLFTTAEEMKLAEHAFTPWQCRPAVTGYGVARPDLAADFDRQLWIETLTRRYPQLAGRNFILFLARVHEKKGVDLLLRAFAASKRLMPGTALVVAGPGDRRTIDSLAQIARASGIAGDVVWAGPLYGNDKWNTMRAADACVLPSHQENFGISVVEALACGVPVLVSDKVNIWREIQAANAGLVAEDTVAGTARLLTEWAAKTTGQKLEMQGNARLCFARNFDITVTSDRFFALIQPAPASVAA